MKNPLRKDNLPLKHEREDKPKVELGIKDKNAPAKPLCDNCGKPADKLYEELDGDKFCWHCTRDKNAAVKKLKILNPNTP